MLEEIGGNDEGEMMEEEKNLSNSPFGSHAMSIS